MLDLLQIGEDELAASLVKKPLTNRQKRLVQKTQKHSTPPKAGGEHQATQEKPATPKPAASRMKLEGVDLYLIKTRCACGSIYTAPANGINIGARFAVAAPRMPGEVITNDPAPRCCISFPGHPAATTHLNRGYGATAKVLEVTCSYCPSCVAVDDYETYSEQLELDL